MIHRRNPAKLKEKGMIQQGPQSYMARVFSVISAAWSNRSQIQQGPQTKCMRARSGVRAHVRTYAKCGAVAAYLLDHMKVSACLFYSFILPLL